MWLMCYGCVTPVSVVKVNYQKSFLQHAVHASVWLPSHWRLIHVCCAGLFDSDVTTSCYSSYYMCLPICVSIVFQFHFVCKLPWLISTCRKLLCSLMLTALLFIPYLLDLSKLPCWQQHKVWFKDMFGCCVGEAGDRVSQWDPVPVGCLRMKCLRSWSLCSLCSIFSCFVDGSCVPSILKDVF